MSKEIVLVEYLYLDLKTCDRCIGTDAVLEEVLETLAPALELAGFKVKYCKTEIATAEDAEKHRFVSSPTIRVNGRDICSAVLETNCGCCGEISGTDVNCRVFEYEGSAYEIPPKAMLAEAVLRGVFASAGSSACNEYALPNNLKAFFEGKSDNKRSCSCGGNCC